MTDSPTISTPRVRSGLLGRIVAIGVAALLSTLVGALAVVVLLFVATIPMSIMVLLNPGAILIFIYYAVAFAAPVTLVLLPITAIFLKRGILAMIVLAVAGTIGGAASVWIWHFFAIGGEPVKDLFNLLVVVGAVAGMAMGGCFGRVLYELGK